MDDKTLAILLGILLVITPFLIVWVIKEAKKRDYALIAEWKAINGDIEKHKAFLIRLCYHSTNNKEYREKTERELIEWFSKRVKRIYGVDLNEIK